MSDIFHNASDFIWRAVGLACSSDEILGRQLGLDAWQFALVKSALCLSILIPAFAAWYGSWPRLRRNGFARPLWQAGLWMLAVVAVFQVLKSVVSPVIGDPIPCPYDIATYTTVVFLVLYAAYFWHLGRGNKGSFANFLILIGGPLFGELLLNSREATVTGVRVILRIVEVGMHAVAR